MLDPPCTFRDTQQDVVAPRGRTHRSLGADRIPQRRTIPGEEDPAHVIACKQVVRRHIREEPWRGVAPTALDAVVVGVHDGRIVADAIIEHEAGDRVL